ncbi:unnamed protein product [Acanthosepion pharaonis]|uniref:Endonuclease-reverse transcriptase n=1 Tax=Acanthosepion pharaonis TaxID=158019 RepID=A0A812AQR4_ACAPH|nr:unnamed protein product [Sepia pharaonis]
MQQLLLEYLNLKSFICRVSFVILTTGQAKDEITTRINLARAAFVRLQKRLWSRQEIRRSTKLRIYEATVRAILLYGCETWPLRREDLHKLEVFDHYCLRRILRVRLSDRIPNSSIRARCNILGLEETLHNRRLRWFGHVLRWPGDVFVRKLVAPNAPTGWRKRRGGQLKTWLPTVKADMELMSGPHVFEIFPSFFLLFFFPFSFFFDLSFFYFSFLFLFFSFVLDLSFLPSFFLLSFLPSFFLSLLFFFLFLSFSIFPSFFLSFFLLFFFPFPSFFFFFLFQTFFLYYVFLSFTFLFHSFSIFLFFHHTSVRD